MMTERAGGAGAEGSRDLLWRWTTSISLGGNHRARASGSARCGRSWKTASAFKGTMDLHPDFRDLLAEFVRSRVRFVLLGGYAVGIYSKPRATKDLDLLVSGEGDNLERVADALAAFGAPAAVISAARHMSPSEIVYLGVPPVRIDILRQADGIETEAVIARAQTVTVGDLAVPVIDVDDLILNKRSAGRPQDLADVLLLERMRRKAPKV